MQLHLNHTGDSACTAALVLSGEKAISCVCMHESDCACKAALVLLGKNGQSCTFWHKEKPGRQTVFSVSGVACSKKQT